MKYICNPINMEYKYQFIEAHGKLSVNREAADPSMIYFNEKYFMFSSMTAGLLVSDNLSDWTFHPYKDLPIYDYAPDVRVIGEYMYFSASRSSQNCSFYRTKDPIFGSFEEIEGTFPFWDPNLFVDDDGRVYFYWGCSNDKPIYGMEMNPQNMTPLTEPVDLIFTNVSVNGYERNGENHIPPRTPEKIEEIIQKYASDNPNLTDEMLKMVRDAIGNEPFIEGAWMDKHGGKYYLQYAVPGTQYNVYSDGVYVSDNPLGPFSLAKNNPYSYKPGGFIPGAGHGSTMEDRYGNYWHASTMRISVNHNFERRVGLWPAGFDQDGELFCNQRYGDWPMKVEQAAMNPWSNPDWMLLSYGKPATASSYVEGKEATKATDEEIRTWWRAASNVAGEWIEVDLLHECDVFAIQVNFADDALSVPPPEGAEFHGDAPTYRYIDQRRHFTRWLLKGSVDGKEYFVIKDMSNTNTDLSHDLIVRENGLKARYIRCTVEELPYNQAACISGLRIFGIGKGELPEKATGIQTTLVSDLDLVVTWDQGDSVGYNIVWGYAPDKLYHSYMVLGSNEVAIGALIKGEPLYIRVDSFNEKGIAEGDVHVVIE
ncbi:family 43 glycosylhydrolase [Paenibacillus kribbensis]|uniref:family 43 glycosylhydrolase n=1 Tax=Paenibacillus kribbensis TaxID=172713 RepID=UPI000837CB08|nr:family 43 glycosylhydrolase [Paenibacillus kribbensis]